MDGSTPPGWQQPGQPAAPPQGYGQPAQTNGKAIAALILGIAGCCVAGFLAGIAAIILGIMARKEIDENPGMYEGRGMATAGLVLGIIATVGSILFLILYVVGIVALLAECEENPDSPLCDDGSGQPVFEDPTPLAPVALSILPAFGFMPRHHFLR